MYSPFLSATAPPAGPLQRQPSGVLRPQGSGTLQRQQSGGLRPQGSGQYGNLLRTQGSGPAVTRRARTSIACASNDGTGLTGAFSQRDDLPLHDQQRPQPAQPLQPQLSRQASVPLPPPKQPEQALPPQAQLPRQQSDAGELQAILATSTDGLSAPDFDSYAVRHLVQAPPAKTTHLSSLAVAPGRVLRRYALQSESGERSVMTLAFESKNPSGGWALAGAKGEPAWLEAPLNPAPEHPPEAVARGQLEAFRDLDAFTAWRFMSTGARPALGGSFERFGAALERSALGPLLMHGAAETILRRQRSAGVYTEVVRVETAGGEWRQYCWTLALQKEGPFEGCWMVESVKPAGAPGCAHDGGCFGEGEHLEAPLN